MLIRPIAVLTQFFKNLINSLSYLYNFFTLDLINISIDKEKPIFAFISNIIDIPDKISFNFISLFSFGVIIFIIIYGIIKWFLDIVL